MEVKPVPYEVQPLFYRPLSEYYREISFNGIKFYVYKKGNIIPWLWIKKFDYIIEYTDNDHIRCDGYYDKSEKIIVFFYNRYINKLYRSIVTRQELRGNKQTFLLPDNQIRRKEKMSMKDLEGLKSGRVELDDAPKYIYPERIDSEIKEDNSEKKQRCLYLNFFWTEDGEERTVTQKYTPFHIGKLTARMKLMKIKDLTKWVGDKPWKMEHEVFKGVGFPKYMPVQDAED